MSKNVDTSCFLTTIKLQNCILDSHEAYVCIKIGMFSVMKVSLDKTEIHLDFSNFINPF